VTVAASLEFATNFAAQALASARAADQFIGSLRGLSGAANTASVGLDATARSAQAAAQAASAAARVQVQELKGQQAAAAQAAKAQQQQAGAAARDAAQKNRAVANVVQAQVKRDADMARAEQAAHHKREAEAQRHAGKMAEIQARQAGAAARAQARPASAAGARGATGRAGSGDPSDAAAQFAGAASAAAAVAAVVVGLAGALYKAGDAFLSAGLRAQMFREDSTGALVALTRSASKADELTRKAIQTASYLGRSRQEVVGQFVDFTAKGFSAEKVDQIVKSMADLSVVDPKANLESVQRAIGQIAAKGRVQAEELLQLAEAGLETKDVYAQLAKQMGKTEAEVQKLITAGKVDAPKAIDAILAAINAQAGGGAAGSAARKKSLENLSGLLGRLDAIPGDIFAEANMDAGAKSLKASLRVLVGAFDPAEASGKRLAASLGNLGNSLLTALTGGLTDGKRLEKLVTGIADAIDFVAKAVKAASPYIQAFGAGLLDGFGDVGEVMTSLFGGKSFDAEPVKALAEAAGRAGKAFAYLVSFVAALAVAAAEGLVFITGLGAAVVGFVAGIPAALETALRFAVSTIPGIGPLLATAGTDAGTALVNGIVNAITSGAARISAAVASMASGAVSTLTGGWQINSPSKVSYGLGSWFAAGAENAILDGAADVANAARGMAADATAAGGMAFGGSGGVAPAGAAAGGAAGRGGVGQGRVGGGDAGTVIRVEVRELKIMANSEAEGRAAARGFREELFGLVEELVES
jgi:tape measure domain-containing protein